MQQDRIGILIAEGDVLVRNLISIALSQDGYLTLSAANEAEALELARKPNCRLRLLITRRRELAEAVRAQCPGLGGILVSDVTCSQLKECARKTDPGVSLRNAVLPQRLNQCIHTALANDDSTAEFLEC